MSNAIHIVVAGSSRREVAIHTLLRPASWISIIAALVLALPASATPTPGPEPPVFVGAGDIASCNHDNDEATARLLDEIEGTIFTLGDNVYNSGLEAEFAVCYEPTWGRHRDRTRPVPGNHDYRTIAAGPYFTYFGENAGDPSRGYYSFDLGEWHIVALNTNCDEIGGCGEGSDQLAWLRDDLATNPTACTLAFGHHPRYSSGGHGDEADVQPLWDALYEAEAEIFLAGHDHTYERFAPLDPQGDHDPEAGVRQFIVGTGGAPLSGFEAIHPFSEARNNQAFGVLELTLHPGWYEWEFVPVEGGSFTDSGSAACH